MRRPGRRRSLAGAAATHPLLASEVLRRADVTLPTGHTMEESLLRVTCGGCGLDQHLGQARLEAASEPENITSYLCDCGARLLVTGHPLPFAEAGRHNFGDFDLQPLAPGGLRMTPP